MQTRNPIVIFTAILLFVFGVQTSHAQRPVGDTLRSMDPEYYPYLYNWFTMADSMDLRSTFHNFLFYYVPLDIYPQPSYRSRFTRNFIVGNQMYTDRPLKIKGIAACAFRRRTVDTVLDRNSWLLRADGGLLVHPDSFFLNTIDTTLAGRITDSLILYDASPNGPVLIEAAPWRIEYPHRYIVLPERREYDYLYPYEYAGPTPPPLDTFPIAPLYEVMFDKPQVVTDSFIVAGTNYNNTKSWVRRSDLWLADTIYLWDHNPTYYWHLRKYTWEPETNNISWYREINYPWVRNSPCQEYWWRYATPPYAWFATIIFPIIEPNFDTLLCSEISNVRQADCTDTSVTLVWNGGNAVQWEVLYAPDDGSYERTITTNSPMAVIGGLSPSSHYLARVRGRCEWETDYGEWTEMVEMRTGAHQDDPHHESIDNLGRFTQLMPNPASKRVTIISSYGLRRVEVYNMQGQLMLHQEEDAISTILDISSLTPGNYITVIHTPAGISTKKLMVK